jgi:hypothetical protein
MYVDLMIVNAQSYIATNQLTYTDAFIFESLRTYDGFCKYDDLF